MNWPGRVVLLIGMFVSAFLFWRKFGRALRIILAAKPDADFKLRPIGPRIRKVLWEVGAQGLVIAQRPLPGLAHALVFWGFCVFALVTLNHFATGFGFPFLSRESFWGRGYFLIAGVFAVAVAISIAGLAFRRFVIRPKWLEPLSPESGLIAFLIFALMVTYLATFWVREGTAMRLGGVVGACRGDLVFSAADSEYQAHAPGAESADDFSGARRVQQDSTAGGG